MDKIVSGIWGLFVSLILFSGYNVINLLSGDDAAKYVGQATVDFFKAWKVWLFCCIGFLFLGQQIWLRWPRPASLSDVESIKDVVSVVLTAILTEYYQTVTCHNSNPVPTVRINIMLPTWRRFRYGRYLKIYYTYGGPTGITYPEEELDLCWSPKNGTCGWAWSKKRPVIYDSITTGFQGPRDRLTDKQKSIVTNINSVLSVPIWSDSGEHIVGILNLDSAYNVDRTQLHAQSVVNTIQARTKLFSTMLFNDGVKAG